MGRASESAVRRAEERLRSVINTPAILDRAYEDKARVRWPQLCASMDAIGDCDLGIESYLRGRPPEDEGALYIVAYGVLQILFVQQDALVNAAEAVSMPYSLPPELIEIRSIRNNAVGHPTKRGGSNPDSLGIVRVSLTYDGFRLYSFDLSKPERVRDIALKEVVTRQPPHIVAGLDALTSHIRTVYG